MYDGRKTEVGHWSLDEALLDVEADLANDAMYQREYDALRELGVVRASLHQPGG